MRNTVNCSPLLRRLDAETLNEGRETARASGDVIGRQRTRVRDTPAANQGHADSALLVAFHYYYFRTEVTPVTKGERNFFK